MGSGRGQGGTAAQGSGSPPRAPPAYLHQQLQSQGAAHLQPWVTRAAALLSPTRNFSLYYYFMAATIQLKKLFVSFMSASLPSPRPLMLTCA